MGWASAQRLAARLAARGGAAQLVGAQRLVRVSVRTRGRTRRSTLACYRDGGEGGVIAGLLLDLDLLLALHLALHGSMPRSELLNRKLQAVDDNTCYATRALNRKRVSHSVWVARGG